MRALLDRLRPERYSPQWQVQASLGLYASVLVGIVLVGLFIYQWRQSIADSEQVAREQATTKAEIAADTINEQLTRFETAVQDYAIANDGLDNPRSGFVDRSDDLLRDYLDIHRAGALFAPIDGSRQAPFSSRRVDPTSEIGLVHGSEDFDYTDSNHLGTRSINNSGRYSIPIESGQNWSPAYYDGSFDTTIAELGFPIANSVGGSAGVVYGQISIKTLEANPAWSALRETGYGFLADEDGVFISHPILDYVSSSLSAIGPGADPNLKTAVELAGAGESGTIDFNEPVENRAAWIAFAPISTTGWTLGYVVIEDQVLSHTSDTQRALMRLYASVLLLVMSVVILGSRAYAGSLGGLWISSATLAMFFAVGLLLVWYWSERTPEQRDPALTNIGGSVGEFRESLSAEFDQDPIEMRVGAILESMEFADIDTVTVDGRAWARINGRRETQEVRGVEVLPVIRLAGGLTIPRAKNEEFETIFSRDQGISEQEGWLFEADVPAQFDFARYPFDRAKVSIPLEPRDFGRGIIAIPDLDGYDTLTPGSLPGINQTVEIAGWNIDSSFYGYETINFGSNVGLDRPLGTRNHPELSFNIQLSRSFIGPLISNVLPLAIVTALLFTIMMVTTKMENWVLGFAGNIGLTGRSLSQTAKGVEGGGPSYSLIATSTVMAYSGALLFAVILAHARLRDQFPEAGVLYLEYFYFIVYVAIFAVSLNALAFAAHRGGTFVHYRENLLPRVMFWPLVSGYGFVTAWLTFY